jgi:hypothetical protein
MAARLATSGRRANQMCNRLSGGFDAALASLSHSAPSAAIGNQFSMSLRFIMVL